MNKELFDSMNKQMSPSPELRAALSEKLAQAPKKRPIPWMKYGAVAACAALVIGVYAVYQAGKPEGKAALHSYVTVDGPMGYVQENTTTTETGGGGDPSEGAVRDYDMHMTPQDLEQTMLDVGYTQEEIDEYQSIGYQMTWSKWWKFVGEQQNSEGDDPFHLDNLKAFSQKELYVNTGALPGGAYVGDAPSQEEAVDAYEKLMGRFNGTYPDWYGGAYIDDAGWLVVQLVEGKDPADKSLELQVLDWTDDGHVVFSSCKYSLAYLHDLQDKVVDAMQELDLFSSCGADEESNRLDLTLTSVTDEALILLARLDPDDDAIYVQVGQRPSTDTASGGTSVIPEGEEPAVYHVISGENDAPARDEDLIAVEPYYDGSNYDVDHLPEELPQQKLPAFGLDSAPGEGSADTAARGPRS